MKINTQMTNPSEGYAKKVTEFIERSPISDGKFGTFQRIGSFEQYRLKTDSVIRIIVSLQMLVLSPQSSVISIALGGKKTILR